MRINWNIIFYPALVVLFGVAIWYSCRRAPEPGKTVITISYPNSANEPLQHLWDQLIADYEHQHPNIKIVRLIADMSKQDIMTAGGMAPDIYSGNSFYTFKERLRAEDLTPYIKRDNAEFKYEDYIPELINDCKFEGKVLELPWYFNIALLYYNVDMFEKAGVPLPTDNWTWDDYIKTAQKFNKYNAKHEQIQWGTCCVYGWWEEWLTHQYMSGGKLFTDDWTRCLLDSPEAIEGMTFYNDLVNKYHVSPPLDADPRPFFNQLSAMNWGGHVNDWTFLRTNAKFRWDIALLPAGPKSRVGGERVSATFSIYRKSKHKEEAWQFLKYLNSYENGEKWCRVGLTPVRKSVARDFYLKRNAEGKFDQSPQHREVIFQAIKYGMNQPQMPDFMEIVFNFFQPNVDTMLRGKLTPEEVCRKQTLRANKFLRMMGRTRAQMAREKGL